MPPVHDVASVAVIRLGMIHTSIDLANDDAGSVVYDHNI